MITVYGADWCEDTRRSLRHLRRLGVSHRYINIDEDAEALEQAKALNGGRRRTPAIDLGVGGTALIEPENDTLSEALVELEMLTQEDVQDRLAVQNVGDAERALRAGIGGLLLAAGGIAPRTVRWPLRGAGAILLLTGVTGWCPAFHASGVTSIDGPADRPDEARRRRWLARRDTAGAAENSRRDTAPAPTPEPTR